MDRNNSDKNENGYAVCNDNINVSNPYTRQSAEKIDYVSVTMITHL
jgi:hypothetical protein